MLSSTPGVQQSAGHIRGRVTSSAQVQAVSSAYSTRSLADQSLVCQQYQQQMPLTPAAVQQQQHNLQLLLYDDPHSEYCAKVKVALYYKGLSWQTLPVKPCGSQDIDPVFHKKVPLGKIPALLVVQGQEGQAGQQTESVLYESEVINEWLEDTFPDPPLLPADPHRRAQARLISRFHDLYLEPTLRQLYPHVAPAHHDAAAVVDAALGFRMQLQHLEKILQNTAQQNTACGQRYAVGDCLTLADCGYPGLLLYAEMMWPVVGLGKLSYDDMPNLRLWRDTLWRDEHVQKVLETLRPAAQEWVDSKFACTVSG